MSGGGEGDGITSVVSRARGAGRRRNHQRGEQGEGCREEGGRKRRVKKRDVW